MEERYIRINGRLQKKTGKVILRLKKGKLLAMFRTLDKREYPVEHTVKVLPRADGKGIPCKG